MPMASGPDRYLVVGNPIAHSRSPEIHAAFAAQTGQHILYERRLIETDPPEAFAAAMRHFFQDEGGRGANVTLPFKEAAFRLQLAHTSLAEVQSPCRGCGCRQHALLRRGPDHRRQHRWRRPGR